LNHQTTFLTSYLIQFCFCFIFQPPDVIHSEFTPLINPAEQLAMEVAKQTWIHLDSITDKTPQRKATFKKLMIKSHNNTTKDVLIPRTRLDIGSCSKQGKLSQYGCLARVVGWIQKFVDNFKTKLMDKRNLTLALSQHCMNSRMLSPLYSCKLSWDPSAKRLSWSCQNPNFDLYFINLKMLYNFHSLFTKKNLAENRPLLHVDLGYTRGPIALVLQQ